MFDNNKFMTKGIQIEIPEELQLFMWSCINSLKNQGKQLDYLQVFEFTKEIKTNILFQKIVHKQQIPNYKVTYIMFPKEIVTAKVFVIDYGEYSTMLLADEY